MKATATQTNTFLYDGWNLIREYWSRDAHVAPMSGASTCREPSKVPAALAGCWPCLASDSCLQTPAYDANGNITDLVDTNGAVVAHYSMIPTATLSPNQAFRRIPIRLDSVPNIGMGKPGSTITATGTIAPASGSSSQETPLKTRVSIRTLFFKLNSPNSGRESKQGWRAYSACFASMLDKALTLPCWMWKRPLCVRCHQTLPGFCTPSS